MRAVGDGWSLKFIAILSFLTTSTWQVPGCRPQHLLAKCACLPPASLLWIHRHPSRVRVRVSNGSPSLLGKSPTQQQDPERRYEYTQTVHTFASKGKREKKSLKKRKKNCHQDPGILLAEHKSWWWILMWNSQAFLKEFCSLPFPPTPPSLFCSPSPRFLVV